MQVVLVYLQPFRRNSLLKCVSQPKIAKNSIKPHILKVQGHSRSSMLTFLSSLFPVYDKQHVYAYLQPFSL